MMRMRRDEEQLRQAKKRCYGGPSSSPRALPSLLRPLCSLLSPEAPSAPKIGREARKSETGTGGSFNVLLYSSVPVD